MVSLVKHDLEFILKQIKIAEAHSAGGDLRKLVAEAGGLDPNAATTPTQAFLLPYGLRTVDGTYNNLVEGRETWGAADQPFPEMSSPQYVNEHGRRPDVRHPCQSGVADEQQLHPWLRHGVADAGARHRRRCRPAHDLEPDRRPDAEQPRRHQRGADLCGHQGAAQMTAISQIQAARAAIANAVGAGHVGNIPSLQAAVDAAEAALSLAQADRLMKAGFSSAS